MIIDLEKYKIIGNKVQAVVRSCQTYEQFKNAWKMVARFYEIEVPLRMLSVKNYYLDNIFGYLDRVLIEMDIRKLKT